MIRLNVNALSLAIAQATARKHEQEDDEFQRTLREMHAVAASDDGSNEGVETSDLGTTATLVSALQPVSIDKELLDEYNRFFFSNKRYLLPRIVRSVGSVAARLNYFFAFMRYIMKDGRYVASLENDKAALTSYIHNAATTFASYADQADQGKDSPVTASVTDMLTSIMAGNKFYVRNSDVFTGGFDVVARASTRDVTLSGISVGHEGLLPASKHELSYEREKFDAYSCETNLAVVRAAEKIITELFGGAATSTAAAPVEVTVPMTYNFMNLQRIFERELGIDLPVEFLHNMTIAAPDKTDPANYMRATFVLASDPRISTKIRSELEERSREVDASPENLLPTVLHKYTSSESPEGRMLNRAVGATLTFTLNKELARYICQSETPNAHAIESWYHIWSSQYLRAAGKAAKTNAGGAPRQGRIRRNNIPRFTLPLSRMEAVTENRRTLGMSVESTRANEDDLYLSTDGTISCLPKVEERSNLETLKEFERISNELSDMASKYGTSTVIFEAGEVEAALVGIGSVEYQKGNALLKQLNEFEGTLLSYDWDYGLKFYAGSHGRSYCIREAGATRPHDLAIADLLGFNMAPENAMPKTRSFADAMHLATSATPSSLEGTPADVYGNQVEPARFLSTPHFKDMLDLYSFYVHNDTAEGTRLPDVPTLIKNAMKHLKYEALKEDGTNPEGRAYTEYLTDEGVPRSLTSPAKDPLLLKQLVTTGVNGCSGRPGSFVYHKAMEDVSAGAFAQEDFQAALEENPMYFLASSSPTHHFSRVYNTLGGYVLKQVMDAINGLSNATLNSTKTKTDVDFTFVSANDERIASKASMSRPAGGRAFGVIKPLSILLGKYVPNYDQWEVKAEQAVASIARDPSVDVEDIHFAGGSDKFSVFPHQLDTQRYLRKEKPPAFAVLDIRPGGGKTSIGIVDMAAITADMDKIGKRVRPLVICPDGLIRNWCDDTTGFGAANWNVIPINSSVLKRWGYDRLVDMIRKAPINTIVVVGMQFLCNNRMHVVFGSQVVEAGFNLELIKSIGFNYIIIDESHKLKKLTSMRHKMIKQLTTASFVEYLRIATGTLIADRVTDIAGQTALFSPTIFRDGELSAAVSNNNDDDEGFTIGGEKVDLWKVDTPQKARDRLGMYASVITKGKKEWAFMLPSPIETFHAINFTSATSEQRERELDELHRQLYDTVVAESIEELEELVKTAKNKRSSVTDDDDEDDDDEEEVDDSVELEGGGTELSEIDELGVLPPHLVETYLQRIERLIIAPEKDPAFETVFGAAGITKYQSRKARYISNLVDKHFNVPKWSKGGHYSEYDLVEYEGETYLARKKDLSSTARVQLDRSTVGIPPSENNEFWKKEPAGKIIIFCRYTNSVNAVYDALGSHQDVAVKFTGEEADKWSNLEAFKSDPKVKILVANEMGMSEGHNLQMASRLIRVEAPWGPGELDQSASRIFRPDPAGAAAGEIYREIVFLDWVLADNTMEVPKMCRLIAKVFDATRFDEAYNPLFNSVLENHLPEVSLSIENTLRVRSALSDYEEYTSCYNELNGVRNNEFHEMRATQPANMIPVPPTPPIKSAKLMEVVPFIPSQKIADPSKVKPVPLAAFLRQPQNESYLKEPDTLVGMPVITDHGKGMIIGVNKRTVVQLDAEGNKLKDSSGKIVRVIDVKNPVSSLRVRVKGIDEPISLNSTGLAFIPTALKAKDREAEYAVDLLYRQSDLRKRAREQARIDSLNAEAERLEREEEERAIKRERKLRVRIKDTKEAERAGKQRKENVASGRPINAGVKPVVKPKIQSGVGPMVAQEEERAPLTLYPAYYHGYLTLETDDLEYAKELKKLKFKEFGEYVFIEITRRNQANAVMDYIEENFHLSDATATRLSEVFAAFEKGKRGLYNMELAAAMTLPHFFTVRRQMVKDRKEARFFPFFKDDVLMIACDLATCPIMKRHIGKTIPGAATKWKLSPGALMHFVANKTELNALVRTVEKSGIVVANKSELKADIAAINFKSKRK